MKVIAINGSPRKNWNTDILLKKVLDGAAASGAETEMVYLYDLNFRGCVSCMACKLRKEPRPCRCIRKDDLTAVLDKVHEADAVVLGSPIYFSEVTGEMRSFFERFLFQYLNYDDFSKPLSPAKKTALVFTMNAPESVFDEFGYDSLFRRYENWMNLFFGDCTTLLSADTLQVKDYGKYHLAGFDGEAKLRRRETVFPQDCQKAFELGEKLATEGISGTDPDPSAGINWDGLASPSLQEFPLAYETFESMLEVTLRNVNAKDKKAILKDVLKLYPVLDPVCKNVDKDFKETEKYRTNQMNEGESFVFAGSAPDLILSIISAFTPTLEYPPCDRKFFKSCKSAADELVSAYLNDVEYFDDTIRSFEEPHLLKFICVHVSMLDLPKPKRKQIMETMVAWGLLLGYARHDQWEERIGRDKKYPEKEQYDFDKKNIQALLLRVKLIGHKVSADVLVREDSTFAELHFLLTDLFERDDDHLYRFKCDDGLVAVRPEEDVDEDFEDVPPALARNCYVGHHLSPGKGAHYVFDYGEYWEHEITVKDVRAADPKAQYPLILRIKGDIPEQYPDCDDED